MKKKKRIHTKGAFLATICVSSISALFRMCEQLKRLPLILIFSYYTSKNVWSTALLFSPFKSETINQLTFEGVF